MTTAPGRFSSVPSSWLTCSMIWNSGLRPAERGGLTSSTTRSNGISWWLYAARPASRTRASSSRKVGAPEVSIRRTSVLTKKPIRSSSASSVRPATGVPIGMSVPAPRRVSSVASAACAIIDTVVPVAMASSTTVACTALPRSISNEPAACVGTAGRGRSVG